MRFELVTLLALTVGLAAAAGNVTYSSSQIVPTAPGALPTNHSIGTTSTVTSKTRTVLPTASESGSEETSTPTSTRASSASGSTAPNAADVVAVNSLGAFVLALGALAAGQLI